MIKTKRKPKQEEFDREKKTRMRIKKIGYHNNDDVVCCSQCQGMPKA